MGASEWMYFAPHDPNVEHALQALREKVFQEDSYRRFGDPPPGLPEASTSELPFKLRLLISVGRAFVTLRSAMRWVVRGGRKPKTIDDVLNDAGEDGTHSILDITHMAKQHEFAAAVPLSESKLLAVFGTQPTRAQVQKHKDDVLRELKRWEAVYFPVCAGGQAKEWAFVGCSGD